MAEKFGTPLYLYSEGTILNHYRRLAGALARLDHLICYAVKANSNRAILRCWARPGGFRHRFGWRAVSGADGGGDSRECTFAGVGKSREEIEYALEQGVYSFNVESEAELDYINEIAGAIGKKRRAPIALRVNPDCRCANPRYISTGKSENKFGIALDRSRACL